MFATSFLIIIIIGYKMVIVHNNVHDLTLLRSLGVKTCLPKGHEIIPMFWAFFSSGWLKVNNDGATLGALGLPGCGGIFCNSSGCFQKVFAISIGVAFAYENEVGVTLHAFKVGQSFSWDWIWLKCDSNYVVNLFTGRGITILWKFHA